MKQNDLINKLTAYLEARGIVITYKNIDQVTDQEEFAKIRMSGIGASDTSKLLGVNPFPNGTVQDLIKEKLSGEWDESIGKKATVRMGRDLEELILRKSEEFFKLRIIKPPHMYGMPSYHLNTNFDGVALIDDDQAIPFEAKTCSVYGRKYYDWDKSEFKLIDDEVVEGPVTEPFTYTSPTKYSDYVTKAAEHYGIPVYYYTQAQQQIMFLGSEYGYVAVLDVANWNMHWFKVYKDTYVHTLLKNLATETWAKITAMRAIANGEQPTEVDEDF